jgi:hypothetical protein
MEPKFKVTKINKTLYCVTVNENSRLVLLTEGLCINCIFYIMDGDRIRICCKRLCTEYRHFKEDKKHVWLNNECEI